MTFKAYKNFFKSAPAMRGLFLERFANPRQMHPERFVWDPWHIENQYSLLRTPASEYFPQKLFKDFHLQLTALAQTQFGCAQVSAPWLSCYTDGAFQNLHSDVPQGPWAYVFSLTDWSHRSFTGGETLLLKEPILDFWREPFWAQGLEVDQVVQKIAPQMNQLLVFDPRIPHGVSEVRGTRDPAKGRLVIHGWFMDPCPFVIGGLERNKAFPGFLQNELSAAVADVLRSAEFLGFLSLEIQILPTGSVRAVRPLASSLRTLGSVKQSRFVNQLSQVLRNLRFPKCTRSSRLILPFLFE